MQTVTGLYDNHYDARKVVTELENAGIPSSDISIVGRDHDESNAGDGAAAGAGLGAVVGGTGGLLTGLGIMAIPGVGPVVAAGWLASTLVGAAAGAAVGGAAGGIIGSFTTAGIDEADAHVYAESVRRGSTVVTARVDESRVETARAIMQGSNSVDINSRRSQYADEGWERFDETSPDYTPEEVQRERDRIQSRSGML